MAKAIVTSCEHRPNILGLNIIGHVGWGFEYPDGSWHVGAIEGSEWRKSNFNGFWGKHLPNLNSALDYLSSMAARGAEYDCYKLFTIDKPNPLAADRAVRYVSRLAFEPLGRNCLASAYDVLRAFGGGYYQGGLLPNPKQHGIPNDWFNQFEYEEYLYLPHRMQQHQAINEPEPEFINTYDPLAAKDIEHFDWRNPAHESYISTQFDENYTKNEITFIPPKDELMR